MSHFVNLRPYLMAALLCACACDENKQEREHQENEKRLDRFYEEEWIKCVNELGMDRCTIIQETGLWKCKRYSNGTPNSGLVDCAQGRFDDRIPRLPEKTGTAVELPEKPLLKKDLGHE